MSSALSRFERKEYKYLIDEGTYDALMATFKNHLVPDPHSTRDGSYPILSVYYDTADYRLIAQSMAGSGYKAKLRLRAYGALSAQAPVFLELKMKYDGISYKRRLALRYSQAQQLVHEGKVPQGLQATNLQVALEIAAFCRRYPLARTTHIAYHRMAFVSPETCAEDLRITVDSQLVAGPGTDESKSVCAGTLLNSGQRILEIKCLGAYPPWLIQTLSRLKIYPQSFSKYASAYKLIRQSEALHGSTELTDYPANLELRSRAHAL